MATLKQVQDKIDPILTDIAGKIDARQQVYFANKGKYWQGLWTHDTEVKDGTDTAPNKLDSKPTDQQERWQDFVGVNDLPSKLPMRIKSDVYQSPSGWGYVLTAQAVVNGVVYERSRNMRGTETWRTQGWHEVKTLDTKPITAKLAADIPEPRGVDWKFILKIAIPLGAGLALAIEAAEFFFHLW